MEDEIIKVMRFLYRRGYPRVFPYQIAQYISPPLSERMIRYYMARMVARGVIVKAGVRKGYFAVNNMQMRV